MLTLKALLATAFLARLSCGDVIKLGVDNLAPTIKSNKWTVILFYDGNHERETTELEQIMVDLDTIFTSKEVSLGFAKLDVRRHPAYRKAYSHIDWSFLDQYHYNFPESAESATSINHQTFMNLIGDLYWPARIMLMADDFNVYSEKDEDLRGESRVLMPILERWITIETSKEPDEERLLIWSQINTEIERSLEERDNSFTFSKYYESQNNLTKDNNEQPYQNTDFLLESGTNENGSGQFQHQNMTRDYCDESGDWLETFAFVITRYLTYAEAYESLWDNDRKAREDEQTNYGPFLQEMNQKLKNLVDTTFGAKDRWNGTASRTLVSESVERELRSIDSETTAWNEQLCDSIAENVTFPVEELEKKSKVPGLRLYLDEVVFGYGRSPARLREYLNDELLPTLGPNAKARRESRKAATSISIALFERMREYMKIVEETSNDSILYLNSLADLVTEWHNILVEFQDKLTHHYLDYIGKHSLHDYSFRRNRLEVIDMNDPNNYDLLTDYDEFHRRFTQAGVPLVLDQVNMTDYSYTLEYMVEQCGSADVTAYVQVSNPVGRTSSNEWGGLKHYTLDDDLLNDEREADDNRDLTLEQFVNLSEKVGNIYLHDFCLPEACERILYEETLYGGQQKFRIPSILAAYDLLHRVPLYRSTSAWPSLFIGKKSSNSKMHIDSQASGFFMYLVSGRKRWIIAKPSERPYLYENITGHGVAADVLGIDKSENANEFLSKRFPLLHRVEDVYEVVQEPGQLIYIPPDSPHAVENLEDIVGIALNLVPRDALARHIHNQIHVTREFGYSELALKYFLFGDSVERPIPTKDPLYATFAEYKGQM